MANFHRDRDLDAFDEHTDVTRGVGQSSKSLGDIAVVGHKTVLGSIDDDGLASLRKRMAGRKSDALR